MEMATTVGLTCLTVKTMQLGDFGDVEKATIWYVISNLGSLIISRVKGLKKRTLCVLGL